MSNLSRLVSTLQSLPAMIATVEGSLRALDEAAGKSSVINWQTIGGGSATVDLGQEYWQGGIHFGGKIAGSSAITDTAMQQQIKELLDEKYRSEHRDQIAERSSAVLERVEDMLSRFRSKEIDPDELAKAARELNDSGFKEGIPILAEAIKNIREAVSKASYSDSQAQTDAAYNAAAQFAAALDEARRR